MRPDPKELVERVRAILGAESYARDAAQRIVDRQQIPDEPEPDVDRLFSLAAGSARDRRGRR